MLPLAIAVVVSMGVGIADADSAADVVVLRDGGVVRGEVIDSAPGAGTTTLLLRREWARVHLPLAAKKWEATEAPLVRRATDQRRERLVVWSRARRAGPNDRITPWIDREVARIKVGGEPIPSLLLAVRLGRGEIRSLTRAPGGLTRLLRLAWSSRLPEPETMNADDLREALEGRGFDLAGTAPVALDALIPLQPETESRWMLRRAATEVSFDDDLRFVRYGAAVFPEPATGQALNLEGVLPVVSALKDLLGGNPTDPLASRLAEVAARGRIGALVTKLDTAADLSGVTVEMTLWVRRSDNRWSPAGSRSTRVRIDELGPEAGKDLADDPQVSMVFQAVEALGLGGIDPEVKRRTLGIGAATRKALGQTRTIALADLSALALPVLDAAQPPLDKKGPP